MSSQRIEEEIVKLVEKAGREVFGDSFDDVRKWCVVRKDVSWENAIPKGKVANVFVIIEALSRLLIRHEQESTDVTEIPTPLGFNVPAIINTKMQAVVRRTMLAILHEWFNRNKKVASKVLGIEQYGCTLRPFIRREKGTGTPEETFTGYCGSCPNCLIFGYAVQEGAGYNVKSRVEGDLYVATLPSDKAIVPTTFNAVDDVTKTTQMPGMETGALYTYNLIEAGTLFVGKISLRDMTLSELLITLVSLARTSRIGGRQTHFGEIRIHIPAILFSTYEVGSGYEIAQTVLSSVKGRPTIENVVNKVAEYVGKFEGQGILVQDRELANKLRTMKRNYLDAVVLQAWKEVLLFKTSLDMYVGKQS